MKAFIVDAPLSQSLIKTTDYRAVPPGMNLQQ
jgi:hypothetical protein